MVIDQLSTCQPTKLSVSPVSAGPCLVVVVAGEADWVSATQLREQLIAALAYGPRVLILDLADLHFCNPAGLRALLGAVEVARQAGMRVEMRGMSRQLSGLHRTFEELRRTGGQCDRMPVRVAGPRSSSENA